jgi:hypothetical protein
VGRAWPFSSRRSAGHRVANLGGLLFRSFGNQEGSCQTPRCNTSKGERQGPDQPGRSGIPLGMLSDRIHFMDPARRRQTARHQGHALPASRSNATSDDGPVSIAALTTEILSAYTSRTPDCSIGTRRAHFSCRRPARQDRCGPGATGRRTARAGGDPLFSRKTSIKVDRDKHAQEVSIRISIFVMFESISSAKGPLLTRKT